ncbi:MAG: hypothetical protein HY973_03620, partial [Candidatus Kerfeldbacteria bacterium]|nr:hypothetical protein [Candidatus Kerfeldbacteria bacterium]
MNTIFFSLIQRNKILKVVLILFFFFVLAINNAEAASVNIDFSECPSSEFNLTTLGWSFVCISGNCPNYQCSWGEMRYYGPNWGEDYVIKTINNTAPSGTGSFNFKIGNQYTRTRINFWDNNNIIANFSFEAGSPVRLNGTDFGTSYLGWGWPYQFHTVNYEYRQSSQYPDRYEFRAQYDSYATSSWILSNTNTYGDGIDTIQLYRNPVAAAEFYYDNIKINYTPLPIIPTINNWPASSSTTTTDISLSGGCGNDQIMVARKFSNNGNTENLVWD